MSCCVFCQKEEKMLFSHLSLNMGLLCLDDYMKLSCSCGVCGMSFMPLEILPDTDYRIEAKFIDTGVKKLIVCNHCYNGIVKEYADMFEGH